MKPDIKEIIRKEYVHGYINDKGQRVMPTLNNLIDKYKAPSSTIYRTSSHDQWKQQKKEFSKQLAQDLDVRKTEELQDYFFNNDEAAMEIAKEIFHHIELKLEHEDSLTPHAIASLASSALTAQKLFKNVTPASISTPVDTENFQRAMELLDEIALKKSAPMLR
tara:strand:- start:1709 stop:2200 length:492 start_codon:yes stop_codon:yes gene_type:complete